MALVDPVDAEAEHEQQGPPRPARRRPRPTRGDRVTEDALLEVGPSTFVVIAAGDRGYRSSWWDAPRHAGLEPPASAGFA